MNKRYRSRPLDFFRLYVLTYYLSWWPPQRTSVLPSHWCQLIGLFSVNGWLRSSSSKWIETWMIKTKRSVIFVEYIWKQNEVSLEDIFVDVIVKYHKQFQSDQFYIKKISGFTLSYYLRVLRYWHEHVFFVGSVIILFTLSGTITEEIVDGKIFLFYICGENLFYN